MILYSLSHCGCGYVHSQLTVREIFCAEMHLSYQWSHLRHPAGILRKNIWLTKVRLLPNPCWFISSELRHNELRSSATRAFNVNTPSKSLTVSWPFAECRLNHSVKQGWDFLCRVCVSRAGVKMMYVSVKLRVRKMIRTNTNEGCSVA
jgi:hypothetical protein